MSFCNDLWEVNQDIVKKIEEMDFIQEMHRGVLSDERFFYYIEQDIHYLNDFARANAFLLARSTDKNMLHFFLAAVATTFKEQENIHQKYTQLEHYQEKNTITPAYENYKNFLLQHTSSSDFPIAFICTVACPWLYVYLGREFSEKEFINSKYKYWFEQNATFEVEEFVKKQLELLENIANNNPTYQEEMKKIFRRSLFLEYEFWSDAYQLNSLI